VGLPDDTAEFFWGGEGIGMPHVTCGLADLLQAASDPCGIFLKPQLPVELAQGLIAFLHVEARGSP
jgi:hypothetical protein